MIILAVTVGLVVSVDFVVIFAVIFVVDDVVVVVVVVVVVLVFEEIVFSKNVK